MIYANDRYQGWDMLIASHHLGADGMFMNRKLTILISLNYELFNVVLSPSARVNHVNMQVCLTIKQT